MQLILKLVVKKATVEMQVSLVKLRLNHKKQPQNSKIKLITQILMFSSSKMRKKQRSRATLTLLKLQIYRLKN